MYRRAIAPGLLALAAGLILGVGSLRAEPTTALLSWEGTPGGWSYGSGDKDIGESVVLSSDAHYAAFVTDARNVSEDSNLPADLTVIAVRDMQTGAIKVASISTNGGIPNGPSFAPTVTTDGRYVCFCSWASDLVAGDTNSQGDVFIRDMQAGTTRRINVPYDGIWDSSEKTYCVTHAMTDDGRYVVFSTASSHMVPNDTNDTDDVFLRDVVANQTYLVSAAAGGGLANGGSMEPRIARNGRYVTFMSFATNLASGTSTPAIRTYVRDMDPTRLTTILVGDGGVPSISADGRYVAFSSLSMTGDDAQAYRYDTATGQKVLCSMAPTGAPGNRDSLAQGVSDDGRYVCFTSKARNLVSGDTNDEADVFVRDVNGAITRVSVAKDGLQGNRASGNAAMSADGRYIAFASFTEDLVSMDINERPDVFVRGPMFAQAFSLTDARNAVRLASGLRAVGPADASLDVVASGTSAGRVDLLDAVRITRDIAGLN